MQEGGRDGGKDEAEEGVCEDCELLVGDHQRDCLQCLAHTHLIGKDAPLNSTFLLSHRNEKGRAADTCHSCAFESMHIFVLSGSPHSDPDKRAAAHVMFGMRNQVPRTGAPDHMGRITSALVT